MDMTSKPIITERDPTGEKRHAKAVADEAAAALRQKLEDGDTSIYEEDIDNEWWSWFEEELRLSGLRIAYRDKARSAAR